uniref:Uncharacterized protein n=1 Tax=Arundo donax TaxID=35708 RepID=A0A0A9B1R1_ARUDO
MTKLGPGQRVMLMDLSCTAHSIIYHL